MTVIRPIQPPSEKSVARRRGGRRLLAVAGTVVVIVALAWGIIGRANHVADLQKLADQEAVPPVQVIYPAPAPASREVSLPGNISAWYAAPIYAQVSGYIVKWFKDYGAQVKAGDLLAMIDAPGLDEQFATAKANLAVAQARFALAQVTAKRWKALAGTLAVSQQAVDEQVANAVAEQAQVAAAQHEVARYQALEQFKNVVAPFDGVVTARNTDVGDYVNAAGGAAGAAGGSTELFSVADIHKMRVFVSVPQDYSDMLRPGLTATLSLPQFPERSFSAVFATSANAFNPQSRTVVTELMVDNPDHAIWPGSYTDVHFVAPADANLLMVPEQSLLFRAAGMQVAVVGDDDKVTLRTVKIGRNLGENVQILAGLTASDRLIDDPSAGLLDGETVRIVRGAPGVAPAAQFRTPSATKHLSSSQAAKMEAAKAGVSE